MRTTTMIQTRQIQGMLTKGLGEEGDGLRWFVASTATTDRSGDIVEQDWAERLDAYKANPVTLCNHVYMGPVVGRAQVIEVRDIDGAAALVIGIKMDTAADNELGRRLDRQIGEGFVNAVSVGFRSHHIQRRWELAEDDERFAQRGLILGANELLEVSIVTVPANPEALSDNVMAAKLMESPDLMGHIKTLIDSAMKDATPAPALAGDIDAKIRAAVAGDPELRTMLGDIVTECMQATPEPEVEETTSPWGW